MRGAGSSLGGPLLCIGDLLSDVGDAPDDLSDNQTSLPPTSSLHFHPSRLTYLFQEHYHQLADALAETGDQHQDHSWTCLTLKLCAAVDNATKLIESFNSNVTLLSDKVAELNKIADQGDSAIAELRSIHASLSQRILETRP